VLTVLEQLRECQMLENDIEVATAPRVSRRVVLNRLGVAAAVVLACVTSMSVPRASQAASGISGATGIGGIGG
jgi:hypothetical protein